jgi:hypothetical protein
MKKSKRGGARPNSGPKPKHGIAMVTRSVRLPPATWEVINGRPGSVSEVINAAVLTYYR